MSSKRYYAEVEKEIDALFTLPLEEFTASRNALASRLKKAGQGEEAARVKALAKPSISAWAVNQLYWKHRSAYDELIAAGERVLAAHASQLAGKGGDMREALEARREVLTRLSRLAAVTLTEAGHNPTPEKIHRLTTTLEALSTLASSPSAPPAGRLTDDIDPPGFDVFATLMPARRKPIPTPAPEPTKEMRNAAKAALRNAERALSEARAHARDVDAALQKADARAKETAKRKREAEERLNQARADDQEARERLSTLEANARDATKAVRDAERAVEEASEEF
jgi:hypothetical protein